jgi:hypothetical protein
MKQQTSRFIDLSASLMNARHELRDIAAQYRWPYLALARLAHPAWSDSEPVRSRTQVVIEGFPRSANTFAVAMFRMSQADPVRIAHHLHAPAQVIQAARHHIPTMLIIREPDAAVTSLSIRDPRITLNLGFRRYVRFHRRLLKWRDSFITVAFDTVTSDFGRAIDAVNGRWGTPFFSRIDNSEEGLKRYRDSVEASERYKYLTSSRAEALLAVPSGARAVASERLAMDLCRPALEDVRMAARRLYEVYLQAAV